MHRITAAAALLVFGAMPSAGWARSDAALLTVCPFSKGDPATKIRQFYGTADEPQKLLSVTPAGTAYQYHLERYGVWVFLDEQLRVNSLRFDAPFRGRIDGIAVGDSADRVRRIKGEPARRFQGLADAVSVGFVPMQFTTAWVYGAGTPGFVRYDIGASDNKVRSIIITSCSTEV